MPENKTTISVSPSQISSSFGKNQPQNEAHGFSLSVLGEIYLEEKFYGKYLDIHNILCNDVINSVFSTTYIFCNDVITSVFSTT